MFQPKLIVTDLDATALKNDKTLAPETIAAFAACKKAGIPTAIATARYIEGARPFAEQLQADYCILLDGTLVYEKDHIIYSNTMDVTTTNLMLQQLIHYHALSHIAIPTTDGIYRYPEIAEGTPSKYLIDLDKPFPLPANKIVAEIPDSTIAPKIATVCHCKQLRYREEDRYTFFHQSASKLAAISCITQKLQIGLQDVLVFGDDSNDMEMIANCGYGVAMGNALDEVKAVASEVTDTNEANGVANVLFRFLA